MDSDKIITLNKHIELRLEKLNRGDYKNVKTNLYSFAHWDGRRYMIITLQKNKNGIWTK